VAIENLSVQNMERLWNATWLERDVVTVIQEAIGKRKVKKKHNTNSQIINHIGCKLLIVEIFL
jgi:hypothetical protein